MSFGLGPLEDDGGPCRLVDGIGPLGDLRSDDHLAEFLLGTRGPLNIQFYALAGGQGEYGGKREYEPEARNNMISHGSVYYHFNT